MSVETALNALAQLRCDGVGALHHYGFGAVIPDGIEAPKIIWTFAPREDLTFASEVYDIQAGVVGIAVSVTLLVDRYRGTAQAETIGSLPQWLDRVVTMLAGDLLLGDSLARPLTGSVRRIGILHGKRLRYVGLTMDIDLRVRMQNP